MSNNEKVKELIAHQVDSWEHLSCVFFNLYQLRSLALFNHPDFCLYKTKGLRSPWSKEDIQSEKHIAEKIGHVHLFIVGFGQLGRAFFREASNLASINTEHKLHITILDRQASTLFDYFANDITELEKVCEVSLLEYSLESRALRPALKKLSTEDPITAVVFCLDNQKQSMLSASRLNPYFPQAELAIYTPSPISVEALVQAIQTMRGQIVTFGENRSILTSEVLVNERLLQEAIRFNAYYNQTASELLSEPMNTLSPQEQWNMLSNFKRESSIAQSLHRPAKLEILHKIAEAKDQTVEDLLQTWEAQLHALPLEEQIQTITENPVMNYFSALEHLRWNNFHYMRDFVFSPIKDLKNKQHDCLINDWDEFLSGPQRDKMIYDFISVLALK